MKRGANIRNSITDKNNKHNTETIGIDLAILQVISESENPVSTREISLKLERSWHSIQYRCLRLQLSGRIHGFRVGRMNLWQIKNLEGKNQNNKIKHEEEIIGKKNE
jgi:hypothetical protein